MNEEFPILIAEDDPNDVVLLRRALSSAGFRNPVHICDNGMDAIRYLKGEPPYSDAERFRSPRLLITDLKMPEMDGFELLTWLQSHTECSVIPTIVLSASNREEDVQRAYRLGANSYLVKPINFDELVENLRLLFQYWKICRVPRMSKKC